MTNMADKKELYLFTNFSVTAVPLTCKIHC